MMSVASITSSALTPPTPSPGAAATSAAAVALRESLLPRPSSAMTPRREAIRQLRERAVALRRELDAVVDGTEAAEAATRDAERRERQAAAELDAAARTGETQCATLRELELELADKDGRIKMLAAIANTILAKRK